MNEHLKITADQMLDRYLELEKAFMWEPNLTKHFVALVLTQNNKEVNKEVLKNAIEVINANTGVFSNFRGLYRFMLAGLMISESDATEGTFNRILQCEQYLKEAGFKQGTHMPIACYALYKSSMEDDPKVMAQRAHEIYCNLKANHPWLTSSDDYSMSVLLAKSIGDLGRIEEAYNGLNQAGFYKGNELQRLSHILALSDRPIDTVVAECASLKALLKENKLNLSAMFYAALGIITLINIEDPQVSRDWIELSQYLNTQKKFKWLGKGMNVLLASSIVSEQWIKDSTASEVSKIAISISIESLIAAQMAALIAATSASAAAASSSASS